MRSKKKTYDSILFHIPDDAEASIFENDLDGNCKSFMEELNSCNDAVQQISIFKEVHKKLLLNQLDNRSIYIGILCYTFYQAPLKSSQKKTLNRIIQDLHEQMPNEIKLFLRSALNNIMQNPVNTITAKHIEIIIDCLLGLLDNLKIGPSVVDTELKSVWKHISEIVEYLVKDFNPNNVELSNTCQTVLKALIFIFQKCDNVKHLDKNVVDNYELYCEKIKNFIMYLLQNESTILNCRLNAGIAYCYYINSISFKENFINSEECFQELEKFSQSSQLCIFSGIMAVIPVTEFIKPNSHGSIAAKIMLQIISISECMEDSDMLLLCTRDLIQWSNTMCSVLKNETKEIEDSIIDDVKKMFSEDGSQINVLFDYVLHYREHYVDTLRHLSKDLFKNMLNLHLLSIYIKPCESSLVKKLTFFLLNKLPEYNQGKYGLLSCIVDIVGTDVILHWCSTLPETLYQISRESNLISHVSDLLETFYRKFTGSEECFQSIWLKPLIKYLCVDSKDQVVTFNEHVLPKLFKARPSSLQFLLDELSFIWEQNKGDCFSALITCVKLHQREKIHKNVLDCISKASLKIAFCHADDQVRLSAFALICENQKTTELIPAEAFELIKFSFQYNINCQSPSFRQQLVASLKKLFNRMIESSYTLEKKFLNEKETPDFNILLITYKEFIGWITDYLFKSLCPGANFPRRVTTLNILYLIYSIFPKSYFENQIIKEDWAVSTLIFALQDTYENNKLLSLNILSNENSSLHLFQEEIFLKKFLNAALILASSTKPPDTVTAAYLFSLLVQCENFNAVALNYVFKQAEEGFFLLPTEHLPSIAKLNSTSLSTAILLSGELLKHLQMAQKSLLDAAAHTPMYGILTCIKNVLSQVDFSKIKESKSIYIWHNFVHSLILLNIKLAEVVEPVVCNSSPEGHLPMDTSSDNIMQLQAAVRKAIGRRFQTAVVKANDYSTDTENLVLDVVKTHAVTAQILLLCCWRTHKEISLLFGEICEKIPFKNEKDSYCILNTSQVIDIGKYFIHQMTLVKHRGAFEQAYVGFGKLCYTLWRCNETSLRELPQIWLKDLLLAIKGLQENLQLCSTRRSAGLPFIIQAILTSEPGLSHSIFFKEAVSTFLSMALIKREERTSDEEIHALNILRALFRDACLSEVLVPFVSEALKISIIGFKSKSWAVRNSSTLLFSALMVRIFGVNRISDDAEKKSRLTGKTFFSYYKETFSFLKDELEFCASILHENSNSISKVPTLYPILLVLGKLYPAPGESDPRLSSFIPYLQVCAGSSVWKIRILVAKALVPLVSVENIVSILQSLFESLPSSVNTEYHQNKMHGILLQILYIIQECLQLPESLKKTLSGNLQIWVNKYYHLSLKGNKCYSTRTAFSEIVLLSMHMDVSIGIDEGKNILKDLQDELKIMSSSPDKEHFLSLAVTVVVFHHLLLLNSVYCNEPMKNLQDSFICDLFLNFLGSSIETVRCTALQILIWLCQESLQTHDETELYHSVEPIFLEGIAQTSVHRLMSSQKLLCINLLLDIRLSSYIVQMMDTEITSLSCFGKVCQLSCYLSQVIKLDWPFVQKVHSSDLHNKLEYLLSLLKACDRDDVTNSAFLFASKIAVIICKQLEKESKNNLKMKEHTFILEKWFYILKQNAEPEKCTAIRKIVAVVLRNVCQESLFNNSKIFGERALYLWEALLSLLTDDEPEIKFIAASIVINMKSIDKPGLVELPVVPTKAIEIMLDMFLRANIFPLSHYMGIFINWMLSYENNSIHNTDDEHPFDKGELNVFAEDLLITQIVAEKLSQYLESNSDLLKIDTSISLVKISSWEIANNKNKVAFDIDQVVVNCSSEIFDILQNINTRGAVFFLLDNHLCHDLLRICQQLYTIVCLVPWIKSPHSFRNQGLQLVDQLRKLNTNIYILEELVLKLNNLLLQNHER